VNQRLDAAGPDTEEAPSALSGADGLGLVRAISASIAIRRRFQFFAWTQGQLQELLPHGVLVCGLPRGTGTGMFFDYFHNVPLASAALARLCHPRDGVALAMLEVWRQQGGDPLAILDTDPRTADIHAQLVALGLRQSVVHGIPFEQSNVGAHGFFAFLALRAEPGLRELQMASMLVPHVFSTYCRALSRERAPIAVPQAQVDGALSEREVEILHWVREGKSNHEIGMVLSISPLTVKNHVQRILKKLQASNRTQAVSKAISLRLLGGAATGFAGTFASEILVRE